MTRFVHAQEKVQMPLNGQWVELQRIKIVRVATDNGVASLPRNGTPRAPQLNRPMRSRPAALAQGATRPQPMTGAPIPRLRPLGQVFSHEDGRLCEWVNGKLRWLGEVLADGEGRLYERLPDAPPTPQAAPGNGSSNGLHTKEEHAPTESMPRPMPHRAAQKPPDDRARRVPAYEKIFADPGLHLRLPHAILKEELGALLAPAAHLPSDELLDCYLQVYQLRTPVMQQHIAAVELGDARFAWRFRPLTQAKAEAWGVPEIFIGESEPAATASAVNCRRLYMITPALDAAPQPEEDTAPENNGHEAVAETAKAQRPGLKDLFRNLKR